MEKEERLKKIYNSLKMTINNKKDYIIIGNRDIDKFIQFAVEHNTNKIIMDIPLIQLSSVQLDNLKILLDCELVKIEGFNGPLTIQKPYPFHEIRKASQMVEKIFLEIFNCATDYNIIVEIFS